MPETLLTYEQVAKMIGVEKSTLRRMVQEGDFPAPFSLGKQLRWRTSRIKRYLRSIEDVQAVKEQAQRKKGPAQLGVFEQQSGGNQQQSEANGPDEDLPPSTKKKPS